MDYILSLDNGTQMTVNFNGQHRDAILSLTGSFINGAQVLCVYKSLKRKR